MTVSRCVSSADRCPASIPRASSRGELVSSPAPSASAALLRRQRSLSETQLHRAAEIAKELDPPPPSFFFCGCAWGCAFHVGAYRGMLERWGLQRLAACKFGGNSAGVIFALGAAIGVDWQFLEETYLELARCAAHRGVIGKMSEYHSDALDRLVGPTTHLDIGGRLFVGVTFASGFEVISSWSSREELLNTMHASMHIPFYCSHIEPCANGRTGVDGGLAKEQSEY